MTILETTERGDRNMSSDYIDYCSKCIYAFTAKCKPHTKDCNAEKARIKYELETAPKEEQTALTLLQAENEKLKEDKKKLANLLKIALDDLNNGSCHKNCANCSNLVDCNTFKEFHWRYTLDAMALINENEKSEK